MTIPRHLVLLSGKRCTGKSTFASMFAQKISKIDRPYVDVEANADILKVTVAKIHGLDYTRLIADPKYKNKHRRLLIEHSKKMKSADEHYFTNMVVEDMRRTYNLIDKYSVVCGFNSVCHIITDIRFRNELELINRKYKQEFDNIVKCRIIADDKTKIERGWFYSEFIDSDISEVDLDGDDLYWELVVSNNGGIYELESYCDELINLTNKI